jgi:hypothetical protein
MNLDIRTGVQTAILLALLIGLVLLLIGWRTVKAGTRLRFFRKRREMLLHGWRMIFAAVGLGLVSLVVNSFAEPVVYRFFPPSPTVTTTPTITITPTVSLTPSITFTPTITNTPSVTNTPSIPGEILSLFESTITPVGDPIFSALVFAEELNENFQPINPAEEFANPIQKMYGMFSYDQMTAGAQWTALWYRNGELVFYETLPWNGGTGGYGYTEWEPPSDAWLPGTYNVQIFVGTSWLENARGTFIVTGEPPTPAPSTTPSRTPSPTNTIGPSPTRTLTPTRTATITPTFTRTPTITLTPTISLTPTITRTPRPTDTRWHTLTPEPPKSPTPSPVR